MQTNTTGRDVWKGCVVLPFLTEGLFARPFVCRLTATALSGLVALGVLAPFVSGSAATAKKPRKSHSRTIAVKAAHIKVSTAILRSGPGRKNKATALLDAGRKARVLERKDGWLKLRLESGTVGWVKSDLLKVSKNPERIAVTEPTQDKPAKKSHRAGSETRKKYAKALSSEKNLSKVKRVVATKVAKPAKKQIVLHKAAPKATVQPAQKLAPAIIAAARTPFLRGKNLRSSVKVAENTPTANRDSDGDALPPTSKTTTGDTWSDIPAENGDVVMVESDLPAEVLLPEPPAADSETAEVEPLPSEEVAPAARPKLEKVANPRTEALVRSALAYRGTPYRLGANGRGAFDCSSFVKHILSKDGTSLPRTAAEQFQKGTPVGRESLQVGDLVFFKNTYKRGISHVGLYIGNNNFIHASSPRSGVTVSSLDTAYYTRHYAGARHVR